ncbi:MAG: patatin-like phospholipase family protein [Alphaproteobacteria bacterium]|nr:patatin-like phospholipase family protein [Alphaproteobacteria bacterium]
MQCQPQSDQNTKSEKTVLALQGGGALGAYQAGAYQELAANGHEPDWVAGISIGAINAALIAGNPPEKRAERLCTFWETISSHLRAKPFWPGEQIRAGFNDASASLTATFGLPGFFTPRPPLSFSRLPGASNALSYYDTGPLRRTLEELVDFDLINSKKTRLSVGAVNIRTGNFTYFDNYRQSIGPEHIMASGALPPGFPPVEIEGEYYWDGGLVSNTPLQYVLDEVPRLDMLIFQVDVFSARGPMPQNLSDVTERDKDIRYSSRTRLNTDVFRHGQALRRAAHRLVSKLPDALRDDPDAKLVQGLCCNAAVTIVHLIKQRRDYATQSKDFEFSRLSLDEHWQAGQSDVHHTLHHKKWLARTKPNNDVRVFDLAHDVDG